MSTPKNDHEIKFVDCNQARGTISISVHGGEDQEHLKDALRKLEGENSIISSHKINSQATSEAPAVYTITTSLLSTQRDAEGKWAQETFDLINQTYANIL